ncbi:L,D-transpeptidase family protein [Microvirga sp. W0021]|uniref:L,D-transpeptidase family protein n=1 Tax=Hohaiivirga grylli TaxID=3133970 RepID=A0ABV0BF18_9HYPH
MKRTSVDTIRVFRSPLNHSRGVIVAGSLRIPCAIGRSGTTHLKREGDGASRIGRFGMLQVYYRHDRGKRPRTLLPIRRISPDDGWCDAPADRCYNSRVTLPYNASCEEMWRDDNLYNVVVDLDINRGPITKGRGSALFLHIARPDYTPTQGCIAVAQKDMARLLALAGPNTKIQICG